MSSPQYDVIIIGAGAAGLMAAATAGQRGKSVLVLDHAERPGEKIRISGGGRCNFTNLYSGPENFISQNPHFCKSALARYTPQDFIDLVKDHQISFHEKTQTGIQLGQLFCDGKSQQIIDMLLSECAKGKVQIKLRSHITHIQKSGDRFLIATEQKNYHARKLIIASGGASIPKMGASNFGYDIARQFGLQVTTLRPALVPLTLTAHRQETLKSLSGLSRPARVRCNHTSFYEAILITHRGLSGPAILQISSYWREGQSLEIDLMPDQDIDRLLDAARTKRGQMKLAKFLEALGLPERLAKYIAGENSHNHLANLSSEDSHKLGQSLHNWQIKPAGSEGYRKAEVTLGGVDTAGLSSQTMETKKVSGLYFIGEVVDVTGHLGGHNFQWAWASGAAAGRAV